MVERLNLKALGVSAKNNKDLYNFTHPNPKVLERFPAQTGKVDVLVTCDCPEFTSLCPMTGQPDFGRLVIQYSPKAWMVESKSLKLYLMGYRQHGAFHESCCAMVCNDLFDLLVPEWVSVEGFFMPRGGIALKPKAVRSK